MKDGEVIVEVGIDTKRFDKQIAEVEYRLNDMLSGYDELSKEKTFNEQSQQVIQFRAEIEKTTNKLAKLKDQQLRETLKGVSNINFNLPDNLANGFSLSENSLGTKALGITEEKTEFIA